MKAGVFVAGFIVLFAMVFFWGNAIRVEWALSRGRVLVAEGRIEKYTPSDDGKSVSFTVNNVPFGVSCCSPAPVYRGTPTGGLTSHLLYEGMIVRLTYLSSGEIVRIETRD